MLELAKEPKIPLLHAGLMIYNGIFVITLENICPLMYHTIFLGYMSKFRFKKKDIIFLRRGEI